MKDIFCIIPQCGKGKDVKNMNVCIRGPTEKFPQKNAATHPPVNGDISEGT